VTNYFYSMPTADDSRGEIDEVEPVSTVVEQVLAEHPVSLGFLFGSLARGDEWAGSDVDVAVVFESSEDRTAGRRRLSLGADLATALGTDEVDVVNLRRADSGVVRSVLDHGERLIGDDDRERRFRSELAPPDDGGPSPAERFDAALEAMESHLR
jgi:predicted nucleotidyltransferase